jgi:AraC family transcriptional regulator
MRQPPVVPERCAFGVGQTHGILRRPEHTIELASDNLGWPSLYVSRQRENPYEESFKAVKDHLIILHLDGPVDVERRLNGAASRATIARNGMFVMPGGYDFWVHLTQSLQSLHFYVRDAVLREVIMESQVGDPDHLALCPVFGDVDPIVVNIACAANDVLLDAGPGSNILADYLARALAARLISRFAQRSVPAPAAGVTLDARRKKRLQEFVLANLAYPIGLADMAGAVGLGVTSFSRGFKREMGTTPYHYVLIERLNCAKAMLASSNEAIAEIALSCGFSHQEHLTRMFRRQFDVTPGAYRKAMRR